MSTRTLTRSTVRRSVPVAVGTRRANRQRYASTHQPTMRNVAERATVALVAIVLSLCALWWAPSFADQCDSVLAGTDSVPADVVAICQR